MSVPGSCASEAVRGSAASNAAAVAFPCRRSCPCRRSLPVVWDCSIRCELAAAAPLRCWVSATGECERRSAPRWRPPPLPLLRPQLQRRASSASAGRRAWWWTGRPLARRARAPLAAAFVPLTPRGTRMSRGGDCTAAACIWARLRHRSTGSWRPRARAYRSCSRSRSRRRRTRHRSVGCIKRAPRTRRRRHRRWPRSGQVELSQRPRRPWRQRRMTAYSSGGRLCSTLCWWPRRCSARCSRSRRPRPTRALLGGRSRGHRKRLSVRRRTSRRTSRRTRRRTGHCTSRRRGCRRGRRMLRRPHRPRHRQSCHPPCLRGRMRLAPPRRVAARHPGRLRQHRRVSP